MDFDFHDYDEDIILWKKGVKVNDTFYVIKEADGYAAECYRNGAISGAVFRTESSEMVAGSIGSVEVILVACCAYPCDPQGNEVGPRLTVDVVRKWPNRVVRELFDEIKDKSNLDETGEEDAETVEGMEAEISRLQKKINEIKGDKQGNSLADTMHG